MPKVLTFEETQRVLLTGHIALESGQVDHHVGRIGRQRGHCGIGIGDVHLVDVGPLDLAESLQGAGDFFSHHSLGARDVAQHLLPTSR